MIDSVGAFLVYHAALGRKVLPEHFNFQEGNVSNLVSMGGTRDRKHVFEKLTQLFSNQDKWILDINSIQGTVYLYLYLYMYLYIYIYIYI